MRHIKLLLAFLFLSFCSLKKAQAQQISQLNEPVYLVADEMPEFPGGEEALQKYFTDNLSVRIEDDFKYVTISLIVSANGQVTDVRFVKGVVSNTTPAIDSSVVVVARKMPPWKPGIVKGKPVNTRLLLPVKLQ